NIYEARRIREEAARAKVVTQMGIQNHANENYRRVVELVQGGAVGPVSEVHVWVSRAWGRQSEEAFKRNEENAFKANDPKRLVFVSERPKQSEPVPDGLDWDLWLGPAPARPFHSVYVPGPKWYRWWDFGNGTMSDLGSHWNDLPFWALKLKAPLTIEAIGPSPPPESPPAPLPSARPELVPAATPAVCEAGGRGELPPARLFGHQGESKPAIWKDGGIPNWNDGVLFLGAKGMLLSDYRKHVLLPKKDFADLKLPEP